MATDKWGNIYEVGWAFDGLRFSGTSDTFPHYGPSDAFIAKYDKCGNFQWAIVNGSAYSLSYNAIAIDTDGNIYVGGGGLADNTNPFHIHTSLTTDTLVYSAQMMYQKYDANGNLIWQQYSNNNWGAHLQSMKTRNDGTLLSNWIVVIPEHGKRSLFLQ